MHIIAAVLALLAGVYIFVNRARNAAEMTHELMGVADDVRAAARRLGFRRNKAQHPVEAIEDPNTAAVTVATAFMELHGLPTEERRQALVRSIQSELEVGLPEAEELMILGRWLMTQCNGPEPAITRASRQLCKLTKGDMGPLLEMLKAVSADPLTEKQREAIEEIRRIFRK
ncbi:hypothetical protein EF888_06690 [Silicimonas algicola]|uniref:Tellurite resistance protein TerB n=1 Tax=Silicimonas algicola TaxID=1826607 RepID=A0A316G306_9RHOB|nr:hypothetical protein [Silicimonas algicola]AZQ66852.1 hypothetical protein EF888_06690 [Silicimonas algicola]PWK55239.1 hypothetical protein C8D95_108118 [Silicimonas algicola]